MLTDTHLHLFQEYYDDIAKIIDNAKKSGITRFFVSGCNHESNVEIMDLIKKYDNVYGVIGIHPEEAINYQKSDLKFIEENIANSKIIAIGEIGLDYHYGKENVEEQKELFRYQLELAQKYNLPVVIHSRDATLDTINILKEYNVKGVIHSFSGSYETASIYLSMNFILGINGVVTFKNSNLIETLKRLPKDSFILETDSPYLTPHPYRGRKNEPANIEVIAKFLCENLNISLQELTKNTNDNIAHIFDKVV